LIGLGAATPPHGVDRAQSLAMMREITGATGEDARRLEILIERAGVDRRGSVLLDASGRQSFFGDHASKADTRTAARMEAYARNALPLAHEACVRAIVDARVSSASVSHLVLVSCTGFAAPGVDIDLIAALGLRRDVARTCIGFMGCHGAINGLRVADAIASSVPDSCVLVCCVELCSLHLHRAPAPDQVVANALFADGAAAAIVRSETPDTSGRPRNASESRTGAIARVLDSGSHVFAGTREHMSWTIGDEGFEMRLSPELVPLLHHSAGPWIRAWLATRGIDPGQIRTWAVHPGGPRILDAVGESLRLERGALQLSREVLAAHGNMSSPTVLFVLERARCNPGLCVMLSFGPGIAAEIALLDIQ
jgi:predicted naringenin-chalcone synthase